MITLYQLHWSHYVEKVRWALDYKGVEWSAVDVDPFSKREMRHLGCKMTLASGQSLHAVPTIYDENTGNVTGDSSKILEYLERAYPIPALYPATTSGRAEVTRWMLWLDSTLGLTARRLGYTQIALEQPGILATLFLPRMVGERSDSIKARMAGPIIAGVLSRRFRFEHNRYDRIFERLEECLLIAAERLGSRKYLVGERFTAADLTLASLLRPATLVPFFSGHPRLERLWHWRLEQLKEHRREQLLSYETAMAEIRRRRGWSLGEVRWLRGSTHEDSRIAAEIPDLNVASNDQQPVGSYPALFALLWYGRLARTCDLGRTAC